MAGSCFVKCALCKPDCPSLYENQCKRQKMQTIPHCRIGRVKMKDGADLKILPSRTIGLPEQLFRSAMDYASGKEIASAGYFIVTADGRVMTEWVITEHTTPAHLHGGASMLAHDILRATEPPPRPLSRS